ncbi:MAG TPA: hypothetical protein VMU06_01165 [Stellaceae bacterium]|nr:hypothetical protein [Stellaceae bacterium]
MAEKLDIVVFGTGSFAARIVFDLAATAARPVSVGIAGRNPERLSWLKTAANARATVFGSAARFMSRRIDLSSPEPIVELVAEHRPAVIVQAASSQPSAVIATTGDAWSKLVAEGGLSATAIFQAQLSARVARALGAARHRCHFINCCFPDVVNSLLAAAGLPVACGVGNIAILSNAFAGELQRPAPGEVKVLAHYQTVTTFRKPAEARKGPWPRVWIAEEEVGDVQRTFAGVKITAEPAIEISGASGVPLMLAMAAGGDWRGHVPGPLGLPGGYPVAFRAGALDLDLPASLRREDAVKWNARFEEECGLVVSERGEARYTGVLRDRLAEASPELAKGFHVRDLDAAHQEMSRLRTRLQTERAS